MSGRVFPLVALLLLAQAVVSPALADTGSTGARLTDRGPDSSSVDATSDSDYQITDDGRLIYEGDMVIAKCGSLRRDDYTSTAFYEEVVKVCAEEGYREAGALPETGGPPILPALLAVLVYCGLLGKLAR